MLTQGFNYIPDFVSESEADALVSFIDNQPWSMALIRRVQHYGYMYDYKARFVDTSDKIGELPSLFKSIAIRLYDNGLTPYVSDQVIVNEYLPAQGIYPHTDCKPCFEDGIVSLSLLSNIIMDFKTSWNELSEHKFSMLLQRNSLIALTGDARYKYTHGIANRKYDVIDGVKVPRQRRVSVTFRKVILT